MTETFDAMTLVYLAELLLGDGHICTSGETIDNQLSNPLPLYKALEEALKRGRVMENATGSTIPRATPELIDSTIHHVVNQLFEHAFQLLLKKGGGTTEAVKEKSCQEFFGKRIDAMITFFRQILLSDNVFYLHLSSDMSKANGLIKSIVKLDNLPARTSKEGLDLLVSAWCDYDVAVCYARFYKRLTKLSFFVRLLLGWLVIVGATLAGRSTTIVGLEQEYVAGTKVIFEVCFVLSLLIGVLVSLEGYFHSKARWRQLRSSAGALESEIWRYRTRSGIYKETARAHFSERPEVIFCIRVNEWRDDLVSSGDLQLTDLERRFATKSNRFLWGHRLWGCLPWGRSVYTKGQFEGFFLKGSGVIDVDSVPRVVRARTERERKEREREDKAKRSRDTAMEEAKQVRRNETKPAQLEQPDDVDDDHHSPTTAEQYMKLRLEEMLCFYQRRVPDYNRYRLLQTFLLLSGTFAASICSRYELPATVTVVVALTGVITSWVEFSDSDRKVERYSGAARQLRKLRLWWQHLDELERMTHSNISKLIETAEATISEERSAWISTNQQEVDSPVGKGEGLRKQTGKGEELRKQQAGKGSKTI
jgi:hypothetical protein